MNSEDGIGRGQRGFGLMEALTGLLVFVVLVLVGTRAYRGAVANHKEAAQVKAVADAVSSTAERLSGLTLEALAGPGSPHLEWSEPAMVGSGPSHYRYRIVPNPSVGGKADTAVVGLEVESGSMEGGAFAASRRFATLIPPNLASRSNTGAQLSTRAERDAEASFHSGHRARIADLTARVVSENQLKLNSFECYDPGQCCGYMREYFANPAMDPKDGLKEKCHYRCALAGDVALADWRTSCGTDFCTVAPWRTKADCCAAIEAGACKPGSVCARVCVECVGEDGSTCGPPVCEHWWWNDFIDCAAETFCDGTPLPQGTVEGWGDARALCKTEACAGVKAECQYKTLTCCLDYWGKLNAGLQPDPRAEICAAISSRQDCCNLETKLGDWTISCGSDGRMRTARNDRTGNWYCGFSGPGWDGICTHSLGCSSTRRPAGDPGTNCQAWNGPRLTSPWTNTQTGEQPPPYKPPPKATAPGSKPVLPSDPWSGGNRKGSSRQGGVWGNWGGRE
jgi:hypothetical protein